MFNHLSVVLQKLLFNSNVTSRLLQLQQQTESWWGNVKKNNSLQIQLPESWHVAVLLGRKFPAVTQGTRFKPVGYLIKVLWVVWHSGLFLLCSPATGGFQWIPRVANKAGYDSCCLMLNQPCLKTIPKHDAQRKLVTLHNPGTYFNFRLFPKEETARV